MNLLDRIVFYIKHLYNREFHYCPICKAVHRFKEFGTPKRENVRCKYCNSLERHRFVYYFYKDFLNTKKPSKILHTAPEKCFYDLISKNKMIDYTPIDLQPEYYNFLNCKKEDVTNLSFPNDTFDFVLSNHVIEHIKEEGKFLSEILRVLKPGGKIYLTMPIDFTRDKTFEDDNIKTPDERLKCYGQKDHQRIYGKNIIKKLEEKYGAKYVTAKNSGIKDLDKQKINEDDFIFIITKP